MRWMGTISKESPVRSIATLLPSAVYILAISSTNHNHTNLMSTGGALSRLSSSASVSTQQDQAAWSYKGMSKEELTVQINFLLKTLRDMAEEARQVGKRHVGVRRSQRAVEEERRVPCKVRGGRVA